MSTCAAGAAEPPPAETSSRRLAFGLRAGSQALYLEGDGSPADLSGYVFGGDAALRLSPRLSIAALFDVSIYGQRSDRVEPGALATSYAPSVELRANTNPEGPFSFRIDLGAGCRWLAVPMDHRVTDRFWGVEPLHLRVGPSYRASERIEVVALGGLGFGWFATHSGSDSCAVNGTCRDSLYDSDVQTSVHFVLDLSLGIRGSI